MAKIHRTTIDYYWKKPRLIDRITKLFMSIRVVEVYDTVDIIGPDNVWCGQVLFVDGLKLVTKILHALSYERAYRNRLARPL